ncbi:MAG TPA: glycerol-3-phosphate 1-O-acyltransferase PlsY [Dehalococcoidia bacterium]|nr:glycerol-3-phosphate 1-O-acyltransferase PlsY [Dehalococcoidia bacterium]
MIGPGRGGGRRMDPGRALLAIAVAYLLGSISFGYVLSRLVARTDIRQAGSGNVGATNVLRTLGWKAAVPVLLLDIAKGTLAVLIARWLGLGPLIQAIAGLAVVAGHDWPVWLHFRGGRGVATSLGVMAVFAPVPTAVATAVFVATVGLTRYVSLGSLLGAASVPLALLIPVIGGLTPVSYLGFAVIAVALIVWQHRPNIRRLREGREHRLGEKAAPAGPGAP